jgi:stage III sporulation protein AF
MTVSSWLLSVAGIATISVLIDVVLPNGQTNKYIKGMFAFFMLLVIIAPIPKLLKKDFDMEKIFSSSQIEIDNNFIYQSNRTKLDFLEKQIKDYMEKSGIKGAIVAVNGDIFKVDMRIQNVFVDLKNVVIKPENKHIDIKKTVLEIVLSVANIEKEKVKFNE